MLKHLGTVDLTRPPPPLPAGVKPVVGSGGGLLSLRSCSVHDKGASGKGTAQSAASASTPTPPPPDTQAAAIQGKRRRQTVADRLTARLSASEKSSSNVTTAASTPAPTGERTESAVQEIVSPAIVTPLIGKAGAAVIMGRSGSSEEEAVDEENRIRVPYPVMATSIKPKVMLRCEFF